MASCVSVKGRLEQAEKYKTEGNEHFRQKAYRKAIKKYHFALLQVKDISVKVTASGITKDACNQTEKENAEQISKGCYNNLAACFVKTESWDKVIEYTTKVLEGESQNVKALFRRGQAWYNKRDYEKAHDDLTLAQQLEPSDSSIRIHLDACRKALKDSGKREKQMYAAMFSSVR